MLLTAVPPIMAPQTTGHPAALPQDVARRNPADRVTAPKQGSAADSTRGNPRRWHENAQTLAEGSKKASAPPTILQIKINTMLEEQQEKLAQEQQAAAAAPPARADSDDNSAAPTRGEAQGTDLAARRPAAAEDRDSSPRPASPVPAYDLSGLRLDPVEHALSRSA